MNNRAEVPIRFGPQGRLLGWYHRPEGKVRRELGLVICNTLGNESLRAHRTIRPLARGLAAAGFACFRFDFYGTGDSGGTEEDPDQLVRWHEDIDLAISELGRRSGAGRFGLLGIRMGATLALSAAARRGDLEALTLWDPFFSGREFVTESLRQHKMLIALDPASYELRSSSLSSADVEGSELLGFFIHAQTRADLESFDPRAQLGSSPARQVLVLGPKKPTEPGQALARALASTGAEVDQEHFPGYRFMLKTPDQSEIPRGVIDSIVQWHVAKAGRERSAGIPVPEARERSELSTERPFFYGKSRDLFGVLNCASRPDANSPGVIVVNAGVGTRIGPHRLYVEMARRWADLGFHVLRTDLSGSGDSGIGGASRESDPYPPSAVRDVGEAMDALGEVTGARSFVVVGVCSGADIVFRAAAAGDPRVVGAIVVNPRTFSVGDIPNLEALVREHQLARTVWSARSWRTLFKLEGGFAVSTRASLRRVLQGARTVLSRATGRLRHADAPVARDVPACFRKMAERGVKTLLVVGDRDPGITYLDIHFGKEMRALERLPGFRRETFSGVDHLFTMRYARKMLLETLTQHLSRNYR